MGDDTIMDYLKKWKKFTTNVDKQTLLQEISDRPANLIYKWFRGDSSKLSFDQLFAGKLRLAIPLDTEEQKQISVVVRVLKNAGYSLPTVEADNSSSPPGWGSVGGPEPSFAVRKVKQKRHRAGGEEYEEEVSVPDLKVEKKIKKIIPKGPRAGETVVQKREMSISKALASRDADASREIIDWWDKNQAKYAKNDNWLEIEKQFKQWRRYDDYTIIISRHPIDVVRMSDYEGISNCHSEEGSFFKCAVAEAHGHGPVAYLVRTRDINRLLQNPKYDARYDDELSISSFDNQEIFADPDRAISHTSGTNTKTPGGNPLIVPVERVRLRKFEWIPGKPDGPRDDYDPELYRNNAKDFTIPELSTYGKGVPGFQAAVSHWAWEKQGYLFHDNSGKFVVPDEDDLTRYGGTYDDSPADDLLTSFFDNEDHGDKYKGTGNVHTINPDEESAYSGGDDLPWRQWEAQIEEIVAGAQSGLKHVSFHAEVLEVVDGLDAYINSFARLGVTVPLGPERHGAPPLTSWAHATQAEIDEHAKPIPSMRPWKASKEFRALLNPDDFYPEDLEWSVEERSLRIEYHLSCDDCSRSPENLKYYVDHHLKDIDNNYEDIVAQIRQSLVEGGYILPSPLITENRLKRKLVIRIKPS